MRQRYTAFGVRSGACGHEHTTFHGATECAVDSGKRDRDVYPCTPSGALLVLTCERSALGLAA